MGIELQNNLCLTIHNLHTRINEVQGWPVGSIKAYDGYSESISTLRRKLNFLVTKGRLGKFHLDKQPNCHYYFIPDMGGIFKNGVWDPHFKGFVQQIGNKIDKNL